MARADMKLLERVYHRAWRDSDFEGAVSALDDDFEWMVPGHIEGRVRRGPEAVLDFYRQWIEPWEDFEFDYELREGGPDRVLAICDMRGRGRDSGVETEMQLAQVWTFRDGRPVRMVAYTDIGKALAEAGLSE